MKARWSCARGWGCRRRAARRVVRRLEPTPRRAVELDCLTEASQGRTPPRKPRANAHFGTLREERSRDASVRRPYRLIDLYGKFPTSLALIGRPYGRRGFLSRVARRCASSVTSPGHSTERRRPKRRCDGGPPVEPTPNLATREAGVTTPPACSPRSACRFARPIGGTVEFLGRDLEPSSRSA